MQISQTGSPCLPTPASRHGLLPDYSREGDAIAMQLLEGELMGIDVKVTTVENEAKSGHGTGTTMGIVGR